jgi:hypothetical protein
VSEDEKIEIWEFEALTWLLSALQIRRHSPIRLITDSRGLQFVRNTHLEWLYNGGISTALNNIPAAIDPIMFWAAGKVFAWSEMNEPASSVDTDAVLWKPLPEEGDVLALHREDRRWAWYASNQADFAAFGFNGPEWNWDLDPFNHGVLAIRDPRLSKMFAEAGTDFMVRYSEACRHEDAAGRAPPSGKHEVVLFPDQRLLVMCAHQLGVEIRPLTALHPAAFLLLRDPVCMHLWATKTYYRYCAEARTAFCNRLINLLLTEYPESRETLKEWRLDTPMALNAEMQLDYRKLDSGDDRGASSL